MEEIQKTDSRGRLKMLYNIHDNSANSKPMAISDAEWYFKIDKFLKDPPSKNLTSRYGGDVFYVDERDMDMRHRTRRPFSAYSFLRATICCKRNSLDVCLNASYQIRLIGLSYDFVIKGNHHFNGKKSEGEIPGAEKLETEKLEEIVLENFIKWNHIIDPFNGFVDGSNNLIFLVDIFVKKPGVHTDAENLGLFSSSTLFPNADCVLIVQDKRIYASKDYLAIHSVVFKTMFEANFREKSMSEIELKQLDYDEFIELLAAIYPTGLLITDANVGCLMRMADRFQVFGVINKCIHHLKYLSEMSIGQKLLLVQQILQNELMLHCVEQCLSEKEVHKFHDELEELSSDTMCTLLDGIFNA